MFPNINVDAYFLYCFAHMHNYIHALRNSVEFWLKVMPNRKMATTNSFGEIQILLARLAVSFVLLFTLTV